MGQRQVLVVDDEQGMRDVCREILEGLDEVTVETFADGAKALNRLEDRGADLVVLDIRMPDASGVDLLKAVREIDPYLPVLLMTAYPTVDTAVQALRLGAADYLIKPFDPDELAATASRLLEERRLRSEHRFLARQVGRDFVFGEMVGASPRMVETFRLIERVAPSDAPVLVVGETGTGKELVARAIHQRSPRVSGRFVPVDCGAIPDDLLESEFFGHERGSFTGALTRSIGLMEYADGGSLFLDEFTELSRRLQAKLLRALQEREIRRVGGQCGIPVDLRVIAATNQDVEAQIAAGALRDDLYYRLNVLRIDVPALRERPGDIDLLVSHFLKRYSSEADRAVPDIDREAMEVLTHYDWPGNVRELQNVVKRAVTLTAQPVLGIDTLPEAIVLNARSKEGNDAGFFQQRSTCLEEFERGYFEKLLAECAGNVSRAADVAGMPRGTLYRLLKRYDINPKDYRDASESA